MRPIDRILINHETDVNSIWIMRQAGRYLPEFRRIRSENTDFINLCLNVKLASEITLQPLRRFGFDAGIIFSDILMLPYGLGQKVNFKKNFGPILGSLNLNELMKRNEESFSKKIQNVYRIIKKVSNDSLLENKNTIGFIGAPWTLLVYMINQQSPKKALKKNFFEDNSLVNKVLSIIENFLKIHIKNQINSGANIIQIFDSWAGLLDEKDYETYIYKPTANLVDFVRSFKVPVICFPREIKDYKKFCEVVKPDAINIDYNVDPIYICKKITIPVQGGMDPKVLLSDYENLKKETTRYLRVFKDHPYIFNLGHGILPETKPEMVENLVKIVKDFK
tara:strand:- start:1347 stop:2351 length:1005 start_codon:yes stop_codon:yes gene_type:complete